MKTPGPNHKATGSGTALKSASGGKKYFSKFLTIQAFCD